MADPPLAHVYALDQGLNLQHETVELMTYDDATQLLMVIKGGVVFAYDLALDSPGQQEQLLWTYSLGEGPRVQSMRCSLDRRVLACQRGPALLELAELSTGNITVHSSDKPLMGFFFTEQVDAEAVLVTRGGLELCTFAGKRQGLRCRDKVKVAMSWYVYTHETRCCVVGTGPPTSPYLQAWQFVSSGLVALPPFIVGAGPAAAAAAALAAGPAALPLPPAPMALPPGLLAGPLPPSPGSAITASGVVGATGSAERVRLLRLYGRVYCAFFNDSALKLELYRFYTDTVVLQHTYEMLSPAMDLSVVDNVLVVHHLDSAMELLLDVADDSTSLIVNPLPLGLLLPPHLQQQGQQEQGSTRHHLPGTRHQAGPSSSGSIRGIPEEDEEGPAALRMVRSSSSLVMSGWHFCMPSTVLDRQNQVVYRLFLDLHAVSDSCSDPARLVAFLQRRRSPPRPELAVAPKTLLMEAVRNALQERLPMPTLRRIFATISRAWADVSAAAASGRASPAAAAGVLPPLELSHDLFGWLHKEEVVDGPYLQAALSEYLAAATAAGVAVPPQLQALAVELLLQQAQAAQAALLVYCEEPPAALAVTGAGQAAGQADAAAGVSAGSRPQQEARAAGRNGGPGDAAAAASDPAAAAAAEAQVAVAAELGRSTAAPAAAAERMLRTRLAASPISSWVPVEEVTTAPSLSDSTVDAHAYQQQPEALAGTGGPAQGAVMDSREHLVRSLMREGRVLAAARLAREMHVTTVHPREILAVAGQGRDLATFAAVYRYFRDALLPTYPKLDLARAQLMGPAPPAHQAPAGVV
mmetsp:Transcript_36491/g.81224  ORF Transcript_36491/g.81224 Transcript_36491/m.81224 type:complete len:809 (-) Transcript_36491:999-3425(-)